MDEDPVVGERAETGQVVDVTAAGHVAELLN